MINKYTAIAGIVFLNSILILHANDGDLNIKNDPMIKKWIENEGQKLYSQELLEVIFNLPQVISWLKSSGTKQVLDILSSIQIRPLMVEHGFRVVAAILSLPVVSKLFESGKFSNVDMTQIETAVIDLHRLKREEELNDTQLQERAKILFPSETNLSQPNGLALILLRIIAAIENTKKLDMDSQKEALSKIQQESVLKYENYRFVIETIDNILNNLPNTKFKDTLELLQTLASYNMMRYIKNDLLDQLEAKFNQLKRGGTSQSIEVNVQIGTGVGATTLKITTTGSCILYTSDDLSISQGCKIAIMASAGAGFSLVGKAVGAIEGAFSKELMYFGLRNWLDSQIEGNMSAFITAIVGKTTMADKAHRIASHGRSLEKNLIKNQDLLLKQLIHYGFVEPSTKIQIRSPDVFIPIEVSRIGANISASVSAFDILPEGISGPLLEANIEAEITSSKLKRKINLLDYLLDNNNEINNPKGMIPSNQKLIWINSIDLAIKALSNYASMVEWNEEIENDLDTLITDPRNKKAMDNIVFAKKWLEYCIDTLHKQFQAYIAVVNYHDRVNNKESKTIKDSFEKERHSNGRAQTLKSFIFTYIKLRSMYDNVIKQKFGGKIAEDILKRFAEFEQDLKWPTFVLSKEQFSELTHIETGLANIKTFALGFSIAGRSVEGQLTLVKKYPYPDNLGIYFNVILPAELILAKNLWDKVIKKFKDGFKLEGIELKDAALNTLSQIDFNFALGANAGIGQQTDVSLNFIIDPDEKLGKLQYIRTIQNIFVEAGAEDVNVYLGLQVGGGVSVSEARYINETLGLDTISYVITIYNGSMLGMKKTDTKNTVWQDFVKEHKKQLNKMAENIVQNPDSFIEKEVEKMLDELDKTKAEKDAKAAMEELEKTPNIENLTNLFNLYHQHVYLKKIDQEFKNPSK